MSEVWRSSTFDARARPPPRIIYVTPEDGFFLSHCLAMAQAAQASGFEIHVAAAATENAAIVHGQDFVLHPIRFRRGWLRNILALRRLYRAVNPAIVHYVTLRLALTGIMASVGLRFSAVHAIDGLANRFVTPRASWLSRHGSRLLLRRGLSRRGGVALVQSADDRDVLTGLGIAPQRVALIPGSGIDADRFRPIPEPDGPVTVAFAGRMVADKGIHTLVAAQRMLQDAGINSELLLAGTPDPKDPTSIPQIKVAGWGSEPGITWLGHVDDIATVWRRAHIAVLPAHVGGGVPKSLLEAAAFGRPLIATDVPGCREIVIHEKTGLLVPVDNPGALAAAVLRLLRAPAQRVRYGVAARRLVDERFAANLIGQAIVALYRSLLA
jgi:glycosyltransferase involved in cell wall biosynthesis